MKETPSESVVEPAAAVASTTRRKILTGGVALAGAGLAGSFGFRRAARAETGSEITQTASFRLDPEREEEAVAALSTMVAAVEANEPGVLAYVCHRSTKDPAQVVFFEIYEDQAALQNHAQQPHMAKLREGFAGGLFSGPVEMVRLDRVAGFIR